METLSSVRLAAILRSYRSRVVRSETEKIAAIESLKRSLATRYASLYFKSPATLSFAFIRLMGRILVFCAKSAHLLLKAPPGNSVLVVKQHPYDYGIEKLPKLFNRLVREFNLEGRAFYIRKTSIDVVLDNSDGLVTVNSTGGLTAIMRQLPVVCCGEAVFNMEGLTHQGGLIPFGPVQQSRTRRPWTLLWPI